MMGSAKRAGQREQWRRDAGPMPDTVPEGVCPDCTEWRIDGPHGWRRILKCGYFHGGCEHKCHVGEIWIG
jgi:hypothetical protein